MGLGRKKFDLCLVLIWPIIAALGSFALNAGLVVSMLLFLGAPVAYLSFKYPRYIKKVALFAAILSVPVGIIVDHIMQQTGGWLTYSIFGSFRIFDYVIVDQIVWVFLWVYFVGIFYEVFIDQHKNVAPISSKIKPFAIFMAVMLGLFVVAHFFSPALLNIDYFYLKLGVIGMIPLIVGLFKIPEVFGGILRAGVYFFILSLVYELTALSLGQWSFPAENQFIGIVKILGISFPFEELFFWIIIGAVAVTAYYKLFAENGDNSR
ncbi:MAG: hypothetical protein G01um10143_561 [Parcubacteria group bacterium Gr01-1014_3]|nr:MAG: hypothetical protein G01um10143_561 [Parcubacteria group bacterium Gr01-1014_3]